MTLQTPGIVSPAGGLLTVLSELDLSVVSRRPLRLLPQALAMLEELPVPTAVRTLTPDATVQVSIVVVTYNNLPLTKLCLTSVLTDSQSPPFEVIVVDNASTDGTSAYLGEVAKANSNVRVILNQENSGFAPANNQGLASARGEVLVLLNNDTVVPPGWLARLMAYLRDPNVGLVGPVTNRIGNEAEVETAYKTISEFISEAADRAVVYAGRQFDIPTPCMFCIAIRRDVFNQLGPLDEQFKVGLFEDDDYAMRARAAGYGLTCAEDVLVHHFGEASFGALFDSGRHGELFRCNRRRFEAKWGVTWRPPRRRRGLEHPDAMLRLVDSVMTVVPCGAQVAVVSKGDDALLEVLCGRGLQASPFPCSSDGNYAGFHPADGPDAIAYADAAGAKGNQYLIVPATSSWWLQHYVALWRHLGSRPIHHDETGTIFTLQSQPTTNEREAIGS